MCSDVSDKVKDVYSNVSDNTCGDYRVTSEEQPKIQPDTYVKLSLDMEDYYRIMDAEKVGK